jgi:hypothetical protein
MRVAFSWRRGVVRWWWWWWWWWQWCEGEVVLEIVPGVGNDATEPLRSEETREISVDLEPRREEGVGVRASGMGVLPGILLSFSWVRTVGWLVGEKLARGRMVRVEVWISGAVWFCSSPQE